MTDFTRFGLAILVIGMFDAKLAAFGLGLVERAVGAVILWIITGYAATLGLNAMGIK